MKSKAVSKKYYNPYIYRWPISLKERNLSKKKEKKYWKYRRSFEILDFEKKKKKYRNKGSLDRLVYEVEQAVKGSQR